MNRAKLSPAAAELARQVAEQVISQLEPMLKHVVAQELAGWAPTCECESPLAEVDGDETHCLRCGKQTA